MRAFLIVILAGLTVSGCASVSERTANSSGVGFGTPGSSAGATPAAEGDYRAAVFEDMNG